MGTLQRRSWKVGKSQIMKGPLCHSKSFQPYSGSYKVSLRMILAVGEI